MDIDGWLSFVDAAQVSLLDLHARGARPAADGHRTMSVIRLAALGLRPVLGAEPPATQIAVLGSTQPLSDEGDATA